MEPAAVTSTDKGATSGMTDDWMEGAVYVTDLRSGDTTAPGVVEDTSHTKVPTFASPWT